MTAKFPLSTVREASAAENLCRAEVRANCAKTARIQLFTPCALGFIGLAVLIFVWGTNSKLSLYSHHRDASKTTYIAKMWIEPRAPGRLTASRVRLSFHAPGVPKVPQGYAWQNLLTGHAIVCVSSECRIVQTNFSLLRLLRAPPAAA